MDFFIFSWVFFVMGFHGAIVGGFTFFGGARHTWACVFFSFSHGGSLDNDND